MKLSLLLLAAASLLVQGKETTNLCHQLDDDMITFCDNALTVLGGSPSLTTVGATHVIQLSLFSNLSHSMQISSSNAIFANTDVDIALCLGQLDFTEGLILLQGVVDSVSSPTTMPVIGGTGDCVGARGAVTGVLKGIGFCAMATFFVLEEDEESD